MKAPIWLRHTALLGGTLAVVVTVWGFTSTSPDPVRTAVDIPADRRIIAEPTRPGDTDTPPRPNASTDASDEGRRLMPHPKPIVDGRRPGDGRAEPPRKKQPLKPLG